MLRSDAASRDPFRTLATKPKTKDSKKKAPPPIHEGEYGRYQIKSGLLTGKFVARAFPKPPSKARGLIAEASGATEEAAITALREVIDARESQMVENRRTDPGTGKVVASTEEYIEALNHVALTRPQSAMLKALSLADADGLTEARTANGAGYKSTLSANRSLAKAGQLIAAYLSLKTIADGPSTDLEGSTLLGFRGEPQDDKDPGNWILHPEFRDAVRAAL
ncbi:hypothetical protein [uncultured Roseobacter sp.]|uniref:hypothetical protein n=1 Tax=uncultured Roseobacter sp. TaxID=114847 RepID=UPI0026280D41|nr:hypothetical protein [uncultured Roseobacter sp.]